MTSLVLQVRQGVELVAQLPLDMKVGVLVDNVEKPALDLLMGLLVYSHEDMTLKEAILAGCEGKPLAMMQLMLDGQCELILQGLTYKTKEIFVRAPKEEVVPC